MTANKPSFKYQLEKATPRLGPGGITRGASVKEFSVATGLAGVSMWLEPGAMRELHWHTNAAEWAYVLKVLIGFNSGQYEAIDLSMWLGGNPKDVLAGNFHAPAQLIGKFPRGDEFMIKSP